MLRTANLFYGHDEMARVQVGFLLLAKSVFCLHGFCVKVLFVV